jgi:hypothetical protein
VPAPGAMFDAPESIHLCVRQQPPEWHTETNRDSSPMALGISSLNCAFLMAWYRLRARKSGGKGKKSR